MGDLATELVKLMRRNRQRHGNAWRKIRADRLHKLFPFVSQDTVYDALYEAIDAGELKRCEMVVDGMEYDGIKLVKFAYSKGRWGY